MTANPKKEYLVAVIGTGGRRAIISRATTFVDAKAVADQYSKTKEQAGVIHVNSRHTFMGGTDNLFLMAPVQKSSAPDS